MVNLKVEPSLERKVRTKVQHPISMVIPNPRPTGHPGVILRASSVDRRAGTGLLIVEKIRLPVLVAGKFFASR